MSFKNLEDISKKAVLSGTNVFEVVLEDDISERGVTREESLSKMNDMRQAMKNSYLHHEAELKSASGLVGGDSAKLKKYSEGETLLGDFALKVMYTAIAVAESNACMKCIVAAPTAGSCGVMPAVLISYAERYGISDEKICEAMYVAAGIGSVIAQRASISGAQGGCQAEIGSASAMAAAGLAYLQGGDDEQIVNAMAFALKNMLGLTCDPVCGLVEVPCIKRNSAGAVNAVTSAQMALAGVCSAIAPDEVIDTMRRIGNALPACLKETSEGGLATTPSAQKVREKMDGEQ